MFSILSACGNNQNTALVPLQNTEVVSAANTVTDKSFAEQQRQQLKLHDFYFKFYSNGDDHYKMSDSKNAHLAMLLKAEKRIDSSDAVLDTNLDSKVTWDEVKKFITGKLYIADFRKNIASFSFT
ncbi:MAG: hypothetical protein EOO92_27615, partial [Pedobacter sp.]